MLFALLFLYFLSIGHLFTAYASYKRIKMWPQGISGKIALVYITLSAFLCHAISAATGAGSSFSAATEAKTGPLTLNKRAKILDTCTGQDREQLVLAMEQ